MAFKNGLSERLDELRFTSPRSPQSESPFSGYGSLSPGQSSFMAFQRPSQDVRANLQRRFTTDASKLSSWSYFNQQQQPQLPESIDLLSSTTQLHKSQLVRPPASSFTSPLTPNSSLSSLDSHPRTLPNIRSSSKRSASISSICESKRNASKRT